MSAETRRALPQRLGIRLQRHSVAASDNRGAEVPRHAELLEDELHCEVGLVRVYAEKPPARFKFVEGPSHIRIGNDRLAAVLGVVAVEDLPQLLVRNLRLGDLMSKEMPCALPDMRDDRLDRKLGETEVAPRVVHRRREVGASVEERSVNIKEYCWHMD